MRLRLKRMLGRLPLGLGPEPIRKLVLVYHSIGTGPWAISTDLFASQMEWLSEVARLTSLGELLGQNLRGSLQVAITFDDGYASLREHVLPILKDVDSVAAVFVNTSQIAEGTFRKISDAALGYYPGEFFLSRSDLLHLIDAGWTVGSHGIGHLDLTTAPEDEARTEIGGSKLGIESLLSVPCTLFAYTWGRHNRRLRSLVAEAGYHYAFSGRHRPVALEEDLMAIPRMNVVKDYTISDFKAIVRGDWDYLDWIQRMKDIL